jgi:hypothetical protein
MASKAENDNMKATMMERMVAEGRIAQIRGQ